MASHLIYSIHFNDSDDFRVIQGCALVQLSFSSGKFPTRSPLERGLAPWLFVIGTDDEVSGLSIAKSVALDIAKNRTI